MAGAGMSLFGDTANLQILGGRFTMYHQQGNNETGMERLVQLCTPGALHNARDRPKPKCYPKTRVVVRRVLMEWVTGVIDRDALLLWLHGAAGAGKSAIAQTLAEEDSQQNLLATFFFSRTDVGRNTVASLVPTLSLQLALAIPETRPLINKVVEQNPLLFGQLLEMQIEQLITNPLSQFANKHPDITFPRLIIIDGLDECSGQDTQAKIVQAFASACHKVQHLSLRIFFSSRPDEHLKAVFNSNRSIVKNLALDHTFNPDADIELFLRSTLSELKKTHRTKAQIGPSWPEAESLKTLVKKSSGQFIYAATVVKYVSSILHIPTERLDVILGIKPSTDRPFAELDALYKHILSSVADSEIMKQIMGVLFLINSVEFVTLPQSLPTAMTRTAQGLASFLFLSLGDADNCIINLSSILGVSETPDSKGTEEITVLHVSLGDFLLDKERSDSYHVDKSTFFTKFVSHCLRHVKEYTDDKTLQLTYSLLPQIHRGKIDKKDLVPEMQTFLKNLSLADCFSRCKSKADGTNQTSKMKHLFAWWCVMRYLNLLGQLEVYGPYIHQLSKFDELVLSSLSKYPARENVITVITVASFPPSYLNLSQARMVKFFERLSGSDTPRFDNSKEGLGVLTIFDERQFRDQNFYPIRDARHQDIAVHLYFQLLFEIFQDGKRSKEYSHSPSNYASSALKCLRFICNTTSEEATRDAIRIAAFYVPLLLAKSAKSDELIKFVRLPGFKSDISSRVEALAGVESVQQAVDKYLKRFEAWKTLFS